MTQIGKAFQADDANTLAASVAVLDPAVEQLIAAVDEIVAAAEAGSSAAFEELSAIYSERLYKTIHSITRNPHDTEEA